VPTDEYKNEVLQRRLGLARNGEVTVRSFDEGIVETFGARRYTPAGELVTDPTYKAETHYYLKLDGVTPPPGHVGIQVLFAYPEDVFERSHFPLIMVSRDDVTVAIQRWHPGTQQYRAPGVGAAPVYVEGNAGYDTYEERPGAEPVDLTYTLTIMAERRGKGARIGLERIWYWLRKVYKPYGYVIVKDSLGDERTYNAFREDEIELTDQPGVSERVVSMAVTVRVEGELDTEDPVVRRAATARPTFRSKLLR